ncbi:MAG: DUF4373 domain-containing protein [Dehalococcoidales bacterium]|nr:DUF4373 domain-containing protein [Dehalococcoidales bacterium]
MARPQKQTVEYFPHVCDTDNGKTLSVLQNKYGNDGYAFWFRLLEFLGKRNGLYFDYNNPADLEFLCAKTHQNNTETVLRMLADLDVLGAIDHDLYLEQVLWCQNFVDGVKDAFARSVSGVPQRPTPKTVNVLKTDQSVVKTGVSADILHTETPRNDTETPQSKVKEIKVKEIKEETEEEFTEWIESDVKKFYPDLDVEHEYQKFKLWWSEGNRKLKRPRVAFVNWLDKAKEIKSNHQGGFKKPSGQSKNDPDRYIKGKFGHVVQR